MTDHEVGRIVDALEQTGELENTLVFYVAGDNGTSAEGGENGLFNEYFYFNGAPSTVPDMLAHLDAWGDPTTYPHMAAGWAVAFDAPFTWTKQVASSFGGTRNGLVVHWPKGIRAKGEIRSQFHHVIDVAPTVLEAAKLPEPKLVNGTPQVPIQGVSMLYAFGDAAAKDRHVTQYFEISGNRAIYHDGWLAGTVHRAPWELTPRTTLQNDVWELYDVRADWSLANDLAARQPEKLKELQALFLLEAERNQALPIDDRGLERANAALVGRPDLMAGRTSLTLAEGMAGMQENGFLDVKNKSVRITAEVEVPQGGGQGTLIAQGGRFGGWSLYVEGGKPAYAYNYLGARRTTVASQTALPAGKATIELDFAYDGGGPGKGGLATLSVNGKQVAQGRIEQTQPVMFSADETVDVGIDLGTPVVESVGAEAKSRFSGKIPRLTVSVRGADAKTDAEVEEARRRVAARAE
jgi:arylsulfatase